MFSQKLLDMVQEEASAAGLKGATAISLAMREALMSRKEKVPDNRTKTYWIAGRVVDQGVSYPAPGIAACDGLAGASELASQLPSMFGCQHEAPATAWADQHNECRAGLTRRGYGHMQVILEKQGDLPLSWVDIWVYNDPEAAQAYADTIPSGRVI